MRSVLLACVAALVGCGDGSKVRRLPDAPPAPDASDVDAATTGLVTLTVTLGPVPQAGIPVIFQDADSTVVSETTTGSDGKASATMGIGGFVTAIDPFPGRGGKGIATSVDLRTFAGVKPGDELVLHQSDTSTAVGLTIDFVLPFAAGASEYRISTNCSRDEFTGAGGSGAQPGGQVVLFGCGATTDVLVEAYDVSSSLVSALYKPNVPLVDNSQVDLTADTYTAAADVTYNYTNLPAATTGVSIFALSATAAGVIDDAFGFTDASGGTATLAISRPVVPGTLAITSSSFLATNTQFEIAEWGPAAATYTLDAAALLPEYATDPILDGANHRVAWTTTGGAVQPDVVDVRAFFSRDVAGVTQAWQWEIAAPGGLAVTFPVLPSSQATFNVMAGDLGNFDVRMAKVPGGYDAIRPRVLSLEGPQDFVVGGTGRMTIAYYALQGPTFTRRPTPRAWRGTTQTRRR